MYLGTKMSQLLTLKDLKSFGYLKLEIYSAVIKEEEEQMVFGQRMLESYDRQLLLVFEFYQYKK